MKVVVTSHLSSDNGTGDYLPEPKNKESKANSNGCTVTIS